MKATIATKALTEALTRTKIVCTRTTLPVLTCVRLSVGTGEIKIDATDLDTFLSVTVPADATEAGACVVACNRLLDGVKQAGESVELSAEKEHLVIRFGVSSMRLRTLHLDEFPKWPEASRGTETPVAAGVLPALIQRVMPFVSNDATRRGLQGAFVEKSGDGVCVVGCDGRRLIAVESDEIKGWGAGVIISRDVVRLICALDGPLAVQVTESHIWVRGEGWRLCSKLSEDNYPNWKQVIPDPNRAKNRVTVNKGELLRAVRLAAVTTHHQLAKIILETNGKTLAVSSQDADSDSSASTLEAKITGEKVTIAFDPWFLSDMINASPGEDFTLRIEGPQTAALVVEEGLQMVLSPIRVQ